MAKQRSRNGLYWDAKERTELKREYATFLQEEGRSNNPDTASIFAVRKRNEGYTDLSERKLILLLAGNVPYMYD